MRTPLQFCRAPSQTTLGDVVEQKLKRRFGIVATPELCGKTEGAVKKQLINNTADLDFKRLRD